MNVQAVHQLHAMVFDGLGADLQGYGGLFGVLAFSNELEDLALAACQLFERAFPVSNRLQRNSFEEPGGNFRPQVNFFVDHTLQDRLNLLGSDFRLFRPCLRQFGPGFRLLRARFRRFRPGPGLLRARFRLFRPGFGLFRPGLCLLNPRLVAGHARKPIVFFHFVSITNHGFKKCLRCSSKASACDVPDASLWRMTSNAFNFTVYVGPLFAQSAADAPKAGLF